jgi:hypothetical protein
MAKKLDTNSAQIIEELLASTEALLNQHWKEIDELREDQDRRIGVTARFRIDYNGEERAIKTTLAWGLRYSDSRESTVDPRQPELGVGKGA